MSFKPENLPSIRYFESKLRMCKRFLADYQEELVLLESLLRSGELEQRIYDDCTTSIIHDIRLVIADVKALTEFTESKNRKAA